MCIASMTRWTRLNGLDYIMILATHFYKTYRKIYDLWFQNIMKFK